MKSLPCLTLNKGGGTERERERETFRFSSSLSSIWYKSTFLSPAYSSPSQSSVCSASLVVALTFALRASALPEKVTASRFDRRKSWRGISVGGVRLIVLFDPVERSERAEMRGANNHHALETISAAATAIASAENRAPQASVQVTEFDFCFAVASVACGVSWFDYVIEARGCKAWFSRFGICWLHIHFVRFV